MEFDLTPIRYEFGLLDGEKLAAFEVATRSQFTDGMPPTYVTVCRWGEFQFLDRMHVDMRNLLHTEQDYEYVTPLVLGDHIFVETRLKESRERRGMKFVTLETAIEAGGKTKVLAVTRFVVRTPQKEGT